MDTCVLTDLSRVIKCETGEAETARGGGSGEVDVHGRRGGAGGGSGGWLCQYSANQAVTVFDCIMSDHELVLGKERKRDRYRQRGR